MNRTNKCTAVVLSAGSGKRMNSNVAKQYLDLLDKPVIWYALNAFEQSALIDEIILVVGKDSISYCQEEIVDKYEFKKITSIIEGGAERYLSVWEALKTIKSDNPQSHYVFIHDGARPFVSEQIIADTYQATIEHKACVAAMPVKDTIKISDENGFAVQTPKRKNVWMVQTPQVFEYELIYGAYSKVINHLDELKTQGIEITDDAMVVETIGNYPIKLVPASYENIKITTPEDMVVAKSFLESK